MNFLKPVAFYLLFLIPIIVLLYFLKLKRKRHVVPSVILWLKTIKNIKTNIPFARLRKNLLLPLQILFLLLAILGLSRPAWKGQTKLGKHTILIIDNSASMQATDIKNSRFDSAKKNAKELVERLNPSDRMLLIEAGATPTIKVTFTSDKLKLKDAIEKLRPYDVISDMKMALELAASTAKGLEGAEIVILSDTAMDEQSSSINQGEWASDFSRGRTDIFGKRCNNVAITKFNVARIHSDSVKYQPFCELMNFSEIEQNPMAYLSIDGHIISGKAINLPPGERKAIRWDDVDDQNFDQNILQVELELQDDLKVDNVAYAILRKVQKLRTLLVIEEKNLFLERVIETQPNASLNTISLRKYLGPTDNDIVIFNNVVPKDIPEGNSIFINPKAGMSFISAVTENTSTSVISVNENHPLMDAVSLTGFKVSSYLKYRLPDWGIPLVETTDVPLIWFGEQNNRKIIVFAFDAFNLEVSDFPLRYECYILMANCLNWLGPAFLPIEKDSVRVGEPVTINLSYPDEVEQVIVKYPDGNTSQFSGEENIIFTETLLTGVYEVWVFVLGGREGQRRAGKAPSAQNLRRRLLLSPGIHPPKTETDDRLYGKFAVNLLDEAESNIMPTSPKQSSKETATATTSVTTQKELWNWLVFIALVVLTLEWWVYHRRVLD